MSLTCKICNHVAEKSLSSHITKVHKISCDEYRNLYGKDLAIKITNKTVGECRRVRGKWTSCWKKEYWMERKGFSEEDAIQKVSEIQTANANKQDWTLQHSCRQIEFWIKKGFSEEDAIKEVSRVQALSSAKSSKFKGKHHSFKSKKQIAETWFRNMQETGNINNCKFGLFQSKVEISCFLKIQELICPDLKSNVIIGGKVVDMVFGNKIIEFNGDFWHANPKDYNESQILSFPGKKKIVSEIWQRDKERDEYLIEKGYEIFVIWESDWNNKMEEVLIEVKNYLYDL